MALVTHKFKLDLTPGAARQVLYTSQGDIGRPFEADLYWNGSPWTATGTTANIRGKKPDDTVFDYAATVSGTAVTFETTEQMTIISGPVECELVFSNDGDIIASANFVLMVEDSPYNPDALSESDIPTIGDLIEQTIGGDIRDEVDALIEAHPELMLQDNAVTTPKLAAGAVTSAKVDADFLKTIENAYVTPEMFGAKGDGVTDDTAALVSMFSAVKTAAPSFEIATGHTVKDLSGIKFLFPKKYRVTSTITLYGVRGLVIDNLYLCCTSSFAGSALLSFGYDVRSSVVSNCTFDAGHFADNCLEFTDYTLAVTIDSCTLMKFEKKGIYATGKGHELVITNCKIYQYEYSEWTDENLTKSVEGIGVYFDSLRADNHINNTIVNYCVEYGFYIVTGPNILTDCHVYSCNCYFGRNNVNVTGFYFDNSQAEIMGGASVRDSFFYIYGNTHAITLLETNSEKWRYEGSWITGNYINNVDGVDSWSVSAVIVSGSAYTIGDTQLALYDNSVVQYATQNNVPTSSKRMTPATVPFSTNVMQNGTTTEQINALDARWAEPNTTGARIIYRDFTFSDVGYSAGAIGTRGYQSSYTNPVSGAYVLSVTIRAVSSSADYIPVPFYESSEDKFYLNIYRTTTSAISNRSVTIRVFYFVY